MNGINVLNFIGPLALSYILQNSQGWRIHKHKKSSESDNLLSFYFFKEMGDGRSMWEWGLDPMCLSHVKLLSFDILSLQKPTSRGASETFWRKGRPVRKVEMVGIVVSRERKDKFLRFEVDDGNGCVPCILWLNHLTNRYNPRVDRLQLELMAAMALEKSDQVQLGRLVRVQGRITVYNQQIQITVSSALVERDPNAELLHWMDCIRLAVKCYNLPAPMPSGGKPMHENQG